MNSFLMFLICISATIESLIDHRIRTVRLPITNCGSIFHKTETLVKFFSDRGWKNWGRLELITNIMGSDSKVAVIRPSTSRGFYRRS